MLTYTPLLALQSEIYEHPRGFRRFERYLRELVDPDSGDLALPLPLMNPMGREHLPRLLDDYRALGADEIGREAIESLPTEIRELLPDFRLCLVLTDDAHGAWTHRAATDFSHRFESRPLHRRRWLTGLLWSSEKASEQTVRETALTAAYRGAFIAEHGFGRTLRERLAQEGFAARSAGQSRNASFDEDEWTYTDAALRPILDSENYPTQLAAVFGDRAARSLGHEPLGLSENAGLLWALSRG